MAGGMHEFVANYPTHLSDDLESLSRMEESANDKATRDQCREMIVRYLRGGVGSEELRNIAPIYHAFYSRTKGAPRLKNISVFLARMEQDGIVRCLYTIDGLVESVTLQGR